MDRMASIGRWWLRRWRALFRRAELERELDDELRFHLDREIEQLVAGGMSPDEAARTALRRFGGVAQTRDRVRDQRALRWLEDLASDLRYAVRMLHKAPAFTVAALLSLAVGVGANTTFFAVVDSVLLRRLPVPAADDLVLFEWEAGEAFRTGGVTGYGVSGRHAPGRYGSSSFHPALGPVLRAAGSALTDLVEFAGLDGADVVIDGQSERLDAQFASGNYFQALGVPARLGRTLTESDDRIGAEPAALISHRTWQTRFGGAVDVLGRRVVVNRCSFTIVGVLPPAFVGTMQVTQRPALFLPLSMKALLRSTRRPDDWSVHLLGRLAPGTTREQARQSLEPTFRAQALALMPPPAAKQAATLSARDEPRLIAGPGNRGLTEHREILQTPLFLLFAAGALVLIIACANVANLLLARTTVRRAEIAVRLSLGADRPRLVRQLLTESMLLALLGGALGSLVAHACEGGLVFLARMLPEEVAGLLDLHLSWRVFAYSGCIAVGAGLLFGAVPALRATRTDLSSALKSGHRVGATARTRLGRALVVVQVGVSTVLLVAAGLFIRTARNLERVDVGFDQDALLVFSLAPGKQGYQDDRLEALYDQLVARLRALPGVRAVTFSKIAPLTGSRSVTSIHLPAADGRVRSGRANQQIVQEDFFATMGIPLRAGRAFDDRDREGAPSVAMVSERLAATYFPQTDPLGQTLALSADDPHPLTIVGVVRDTKYSAQREAIAPLLYLPWRQQRASVPAVSFSLRTAGEPLALGPAVRAAVDEVAPGLPVAGLDTLRARARTTFAPERLVADLLGLSGMLAVLLAALGLYGLMAYSVAQRSNEIGIRLALGAGQGGVLRLVLAQGLRLCAVGLVAGGLAAAALAGLLDAHLYGVSGLDPVTFALVVVGLLSIAAVACWVPARRATLVDPVVALRSE